MINYMNWLFDRSYKNVKFIYENLAIINDFLNLVLFLVILSPECHIASVWTKYWEEFRS